MTLNAGTGVFRSNEKAGWEVLSSWLGVLRQLRCVSIISWQKLTHFSKELLDFLSKWHQVSQAMHLRLQTNCGHYRIQKKHSDVLCFLVAGRRMFQSPRAAPSSPFRPVAWYPRKLNGNPVFFRLCYSHQASFASLTVGHRHVCRFESKLSPSSMSMPTPFGREARCLKTKKSTAFCCTFL